MTKLLEDAVAATRLMPSETQDAIARFMLDALDEAAPAPILDEDLAAVEDGLAQADRGEFSTDAEVAAAFSRFSG